MPQLLSVKEVAHYLSVSEHAVRKALREGRLQRANTAYERPLFDLEDVKRFVALKGSSVVAVLSAQRPLSVKEVAHHVGVSETAVRKAMREGRLRRCTSLLDPRPLFDMEEVKRFASQHEPGARQSARAQERVVFQRAARLTNELETLLPQLKMLLAQHTKEERPE